MISKDYAQAHLVWVAIVGSATQLAVVLVERRHRRRVIFQTLLFTIALTLTGFIDAISRQLYLTEPGIGVGVMAMLAVVGIAAGEWLLGDRSRVQASRKEEVAP